MNRVPSRPVLLAAVAVLVLLAAPKHAWAQG